MEINVLVDGGWAGFIAVILGAAALIVSLALGKGDVTACADGTKRYGDRPTGLFVIWLVWLIARTYMPDSWLTVTPVALVVPGLGAAILAATTAILIRALAMCFSSAWTWRVGLRQVRFFLMPALSGWLFSQDLAIYPAEWWAIAGIEAALLLPFLIRLGHDDRQMMP